MMASELVRPRRGVLRLVLLLLLGASPVFSQSSSSAVTSQSSSSAVTVMTDVMVPMRDGVRLATDIYLSSGDLSSIW